MDIPSSIAAVKAVKNGVDLVRSVLGLAKGCAGPASVGGKERRCRYVAGISAGRNRSAARDQAPSRRGCGQAEPLTTVAAPPWLFADHPRDSDDPWVKLGQRT